MLIISSQMFSLDEYIPKDYEKFHNMTVFLYEDDKEKMRYQKKLGRRE